MRVAKIFAAAALAAVAQSAAAEDTPLTVEGCLAILSGLQALGYAGQQLNESRPAPPDAKQYRLGAARFTIAMDIAALNRVSQEAQRAQQQFAAEQPSPRPAEPGKPISADERDDIVKANQRLQANWAEMLKKPCSVTLGRLDESDLKIGDAPDQNQIPVAVLAALMPIISKNK